MPPKPVTITALGFLVYLVSLSPGEAGGHGNNFVEWVGDGAGKIVDFVDGLVSDDQSPSTSTAP